ncbi:hypothetical protein AVEN_8384-1 [Araneus ventricosus]|uniref:Uncharacterized protein n=1 Tax=Araneus ventricosus TaxID=182803 RepID=A0A4Y2KDW9_ARAVE|nr:hypothetical protein AVEN_8384-1 [Araneus ventricosus]
MPTCCAAGCSNNSKSGFKLYPLPVVPQQLLEGNETSLSIDERSVNGDSREEIENPKRKLNLLENSFDGISRRWATSKDIFLLYSLMIK